MRSYEHLCAPAACRQGPGNERAGRRCLEVEGPGEGLGQDFSPHRLLTTGVDNALLVGWACPVPGSSMPGLHPLDASSTLSPGVTN